VTDLVKGLVGMMDCEGFTGPVNMGNPEEFTILELARKVLALTGSSVPIIRKPLPADDPERRRPDISLARERLAWEPTIPLEEGLTNTIAYFRKLLSEGKRGCL
jgi:UDP-glucuronate decarboxylase